MPLAEHHGLDYDTEFLDPGDSDVARAFQSLVCGGELLLLYREKSAFPAVSKRTARRGAKWFTEGFSEEGGRCAAVFLTHALGLLLAEAVTRTGHPDGGQAHRERVELVSRYYPLSKEDQGKLDACLREYRVMDTHEVPEEVKIGIETGTASHMALLPPDASNPDADPEAVEIQLRYAQSYLKGEAGLAAIQMVIGSERFAQIEDDLVHPGRLHGIKGIEQELGDASWWQDAAEKWSEAIRGAGETYRPSKASPSP